MHSLFSLLTSLLKKAYIIVGFFLILTSFVYGQNETQIDSFEQIYIDKIYEEEDHLKILVELASNHPDPEKALIYSETLIKEARALNSIIDVYGGLLLKGNALTRKGDYTEALQSYFNAANIAIEEKENKKLGLVNITIADVYSNMGNHDNAIEYYQKGITILRKEKDSVGLASALLNAGDEYLNQKKLDTAIVYFEESGLIFKNIDYLMGTAYNLGNVGMVYAELGKDSLALVNIKRAITILEEIEEYNPISDYLTYMSEIYGKNKNWNTAVKYSELSLELAQKYGLKKQISDANLQLSNLYEERGDLIKYIEYYKTHIAYKDSVNNITSVQQMATIRADYEISQKQIEVDLLNEQKRAQRIINFAIVIALFLVVLLLFGLFRRYQFIKTTKKIIEKEKARSENLLLNILPEETAKELKEIGKVKAKKFESVTVLFSDFNEFTKYAENLSPEELVESVDFYFSKFDEIMDKYGLEKIKTVGDAYMCAGGLPFPTQDHANKMLLAAIEIIEFVKESKENNPANKTRFDIRIGINTGPIVAGVVGSKKFAYDIWGDTVNVASRMETNSELGRINVSENTYNLINNSFDCDYRGEIKVKNRGSMKMYFVNKVIS
jgi:class 3 adenylate cyclase